MAGQQPGESVLIDGDNHDHLAKSLRMRIGEHLVVCDGRQTDYEAEIVEVGKNQTQIRLLSSQVNKAESPARITLYQGMPKGQKMDLIVQKSVEAGVASIVPIYTKRSIPQGSDKEKKSARWNRIALEAAKQSGRGIVPQVEEALEWKDTIGRLMEHELVLVAYEEQKEQGLKAILQQRPTPSSVGIIIGPEGGFDPEEIAMLKSFGVHPIGLGPRILRTETAAITLLSMMVYEWECSIGGNP
jgi:16S rRNA (uracil1498-N3)-methyltransferase